MAYTTWGTGSRSSGCTATNVNVTIAGTDPNLPPGQAVTGTKWNIDALEDTRIGGASSTINFQPISDSPAAWVQVIRSPSIFSAGTPVHEKELRVADAGSTPGVVDSARKRRAVGKRSPRKKEKREEFCRKLAVRDGGRDSDG
ncbi:hypothetical protein V1504DRAFT_471606 [Lipomyces starkeyi]